MTLRRHRREMNVTFLIVIKRLGTKPSGINQETSVEEIAPVDSPILEVHAINYVVAPLRITGVTA